MQQTKKQTTIYNLHRPLEVWQRIWSLHFRDLFIKVKLDQTDLNITNFKASEIGNLNIAKYTINAYRVVVQRLLAVERFHRAERFQKDLLEPIIHVFWRSKAHEIREIVLQCVFKIVQSESKNLSSAWERVFEVFLLRSSMFAVFCIFLRFSRFSVLRFYHIFSFIQF